MQRLSLSSPVQRMIDQLVERFIGNRPIVGLHELVKLSRASNMKAGEHYSAFQDLYDVAEYALNNYAINYLSSSIIDNIDLMSDLQHMLPANGRSDAGSARYYRSVPLALGYLVSVLSQPEDSDLFLDPSAGTGSLSTFINRTKSRIIANESNDFRYHLLQSNLMYKKVFNDDASRLHEYPRFIDAPITKVIVNSPVFSDVASGEIAQQLTAKHLLSAYQTLQQKGTMIVLINCEFDKVRLAYKHFFKSVASVRISLDAELDFPRLNVRQTSFRSRIMIVHNYDPGRNPSSPPRLNLPTLYEYLGIG